jgi:hypothetical protein
MVPFRMSGYTTSPNWLCGSFVRAGFAAFDNWAMSARSANPTSYTEMACQGTNCYTKPLIEIEDTMINSAAVLFPTVVSLNIGDEFLSPIGSMNGFRTLNIVNFEAGDEFTLGSDTWKVFPWYSKGSKCKNRGVAYLKN